MLFEEQKNENYYPVFWGLIKKYKIETSIFLIIFFLIFFYIIFLSAPKDFPTNSIYNLKSGQTLLVVADNFSEAKIIRSSFWFKSFVYIFSMGCSKVISGNYAFNGRQGVIALAWRVSHGSYDVSPVKVTIPEGNNSFEIADILSKKFPSFDEGVFLNLVEKEKLEGYLFPDTYFIMPGMSEAEILKLMTDNFNTKTKDLAGDIKSFGKPESDVIKMASIIEEEARTTESREIIAGILWKRISIGMALQVDSSFKYINGKTTADLTINDLKVDSPYNSYTNTGLPPTPISNPGLDAIRATINPIKTPYLYFLTDKNGEMHYSSTFEEHVANKLKYL